MKLFFVISIVLLSSYYLKSQTIKQNIRGTVVDDYTKTPMQSVNVIILKGAERIGTYSDDKGNFEFKDIEIGRLNILFSFVGYKELLIKNVYLNSAKELIINVSMEEDVGLLKEIVLEKSKKENQRHKLNELVSVSSNYFSFEESNSYAGSLNDPGRMVHNFAGVSQSSDERNDIVIRGNNPLGVVWQINGLTVHNPNHFSGMGSSGGAIPILNNNLLDHTNFFTGSFPARFNNATSGVFDIKTREGNNSNLEITTQIGFTGLEAGIEGPIEKGRSSYIVNYRYSFLLALMEMGLDIGYNQVPQYQDINFNIKLLSDDYGKFEVYGIGGFSSLLMPRDTTSGYGVLYDFKSSLGIFGVKNTYFFNNNTRQETHLGFSGKHNLVEINRKYKNEKHYSRLTDVDSYETKFLFKYNLFSKIDSKNYLNGGLYLDWMLFKYDQKNKEGTLNLDTGNKHTQMLGGFVNYRNKYLKYITFNLGLNIQYFQLNKKISYEPRFNVKYDLSKGQNISLSYGNHSQRLPMVYYYTKDNKGDLNNLNLDFIRANHITLGYNNNFLSNWAFKLEAYYQSIYDIPVNKKSSSYSFVNTGAEYVIIPPQVLENNGLGENYGVEFTLEKRLSMELGLNYYLMTTFSLYESKYIASDKKYRNTKWNENYLFNCIAGLEFRLDNEKKHLLGCNVKINRRGNKRARLYDYEKRLPYYFRLDFKVIYKINLANFTHEINVDIQNITNRRNVKDIEYFFDSNGEIEKYETYELGIIPTLNYRIYF